MRLKNFFAALFSGRNGTDELFFATSAGFIVLTFVNIYARSWLVYVLSVLLFIVTIFRLISRNIPKRAEENRKFLALPKAFSNWFAGRKERMNQNKNYCFKRCPNCGKTLRLPRVQGKHSTRCPACRAEFDVRVYFK